MHLSNLGAGWMSSGGADSSHIRPSAHRTERLRVLEVSNVMLGNPMQQWRTVVSDNSQGAPHWKGRSS